MRPSRPAVVRAFLTLLAGTLAGCARSPVVIAPPRVPEGGRALSIAVASTDPERMVVATETGGLFRTFDGGESWQHLDGLPNYATRDVAIASLDPNAVIATAGASYRTMNDGGIWRSRDGGASWSQPAGWAPPPGPGCPSRPGAFGISHQPLSRTFYVGTDCGIAVSTDNGETWSNLVLDPAATGFDSLQHRVRSLHVLNRAAGVAAADRGLFFLAPDGRWTKAQDVETSGQVPVLHAFDSPWFTGRTNVFFHASGGQKLWLSTDGGATWARIPAPSNNVREAFVRVARPVSGDERLIDVYYGDGVRLQRQSFAPDGSGGSGWTGLTMDHSDPSDIAFDLERRVPVLLATDGGVHRTMDRGATWTMTGGGFGGFVALQVSDMSGQAVEGSRPHLDLYFATQDNLLRASPDGGQTWAGLVAAEGRFVAVDPKSVDHQGARVTGLRCAPCSAFAADPHFANVRAWPNAPDGSGPSFDAPFLIGGDSYLQYALDASPNPPAFDAFVTASGGSAWARRYTLAQKPRGVAIFAASPANPTVFQGVERPGAIPNGGFRFGLVRVDDLAGQAAVTRADTNGLSAIGSLRTPISRRLVVGVDPGNASRLIAADVQDREMKYSADGGRRWHSLPALTAAVTDSGRYLFTVGDQSLATVVSWDPYDRCHILVGTTQNGVIRSTDGGNTWRRIDRSRSVTFVSSFFFPPTGSVWVSTNGRGLWNLRLDRSPGADPGRCRFPSPSPAVRPGGVAEAIDPATGGTAPFTGPGDSAVCPTCTVVVVRDGWITDVELAGETVRRVHVSGGAISALDRSGRETPLPVPNAYRPGEGRFGVGPAADRLRSIIGTRRIRALVLEGSRLRRLVVAGEDLSFAPTRSPVLVAYGLEMSGGAEVFPGDTVRVTGSGFLPSRGSGRAAPVRIHLDGRTVATDVPVGPDGSFRADIPVGSFPGDVVVTAEQRDGLRLGRARTLLEVGRREETRAPPRTPSR